MMRQALIAVAVAALVVAVASGQPQRSPAALDDLLAEVRAMRVEINQAAAGSMQAQLVTARLRLQESRVVSLAQQLNNVRQQMAQTQLALAPYATQMKQAQETNSEILAPLRSTIDQLQRRDRELQAEEAEIARLLRAEEDRWAEVNERLSQLEQSLTRPR
jgi:chromosome segregation ATPase